MKPPTKPGRVWLYSLSLVLALPLVYALSIGPAAVVVGRKMIPSPALESIYDPLKKFADATNTEEFFRSYIRLWLNATGTTL